MHSRFPASPLIKFIQKLHSTGNLKTQQEFIKTDCKSINLYLNISFSKHTCCKEIDLIDIVFEIEIKNRNG